MRHNEHFEKVIGGKVFWTFKKSYSYDSVSVFRDMILGHTPGVYMGDVWIELILPNTTVAVDMDEPTYLKLWETK